MYYYATMGVHSRKEKKFIAFSGVALDVHPIIFYAKINKKTEDHHYTLVWWKEITKDEFIACNKAAEEVDTNA